MPTVRIRTAAKIDLVTKSLATRWTFLRILRPSPIEAGIALKFRETRTRSATPLAIWLPEPRATATSERLRAGTSLTPSPTMAMRRPLAASASTRLALLVGGDAGEDPVVLGHLAEGHIVVLGELGPGGDPAGGVDARGGGDGGDGRRAVAGDDLDVDALAQQEGDGGGGVAAHPLGEDGEGDRGERRQLRRLVGGGLGDRPVGAGQEQDALALGGALLDGVARALVEAGGVGQDVGRAEDDALAVVELEPAPLPARRERHLDGDAARLARDGLGDRVGGRVAPAEVRGEAAEHGPGLVLGAGERDDLVEAEGAVGEGAGLVDADHVDPGQRLDRVQPLDERAAPGHAAGGDGEGDAREQHEALGDERDDARGGLGDRLADRGVVHVQGEDERPADRDHHEHQQPQQAVDVLLQRRERLAVALGLADELVGVGVGADLVGEVDPRPGDAERAGLHGVAGAPGDRVGLAGEHRLVELQAAGLGERAVGDDLLARAEPDRVAGDDVLDEQRALLAVPQHAGARGDEQGEPVELLLGPDLLQDPDPGVDQQDDREDQVRDLSGDDQGDRERAQDQVEQRERVLADDRPVAAAGRRGHGGTAHGEPPFGLGLGQPWCRDRCHDDNPSVAVGEAMATAVPFANPSRCAWSAALVPALRVELVELDLVGLEGVQRPVLGDQPGSAASRAAASCRAASRLGRVLQDVACVAGERLGPRRRRAGRGSRARRPPGPSSTTRAADPHLAAQLGPVEDQGGGRVPGQLARLAAVPAGRGEEPATASIRRCRTIRADGRPSGPTVARVIARGSADACRSGLARATPRRRTFGGVAGRLEVLRHPPSLGGPGAPLIRVFPSTSPRVATDGG